jgi:hypothetical protein
MFSTSLFRLSLPILAGAVALTTLVGCDANVRFGVGRSYDRTWHGDPYCRNNWDYGCDYGRRDGGRIRIIFGRRHPGWRGGWNIVADANRATSWEQEFNLSERAVKGLKSAFDSALDGDSSKLLALGLDKKDVKNLQKFKMPSDESIKNAAHKLGVKSVDLRDFVEVFTIRMKTDLASNQ